MQKVGGPSPLSPTSFHGPGLRATPARTLSRSGSGSELALPAPSVPRPAPSPPDAWPVAGNLRTARVAECQPSTRKRLPPRSAKPARSTPPASLRSAAPSRRGPAGQRTPQGNVARPAPTPPPSKRGGVKRRGEYSVRRPSRAFRSPPGAQPARRLARRRKPQNGPCGGVPAHAAKRKRLPPRSAKPPRFLSNAEIRRQRGGARVRFAPPGRDGRSRIRPVLADSAARPHGPFHQNLRIFFLRFQHFILILSPSRTEYSPSLASLGSPLSEGAGRAADATGERRPPRVLRRSPRALRSPSTPLSVAHPSRAFRSPPGAQPSRRLARRGKPQNGPCGGVSAHATKRKGCLRVRPSLRVSFPTRRPGGNAEVPASASRRPTEMAGLAYGPFWPIPPPSRTAHSAKIYEYFS